MDLHDPWSPTLTTCFIIPTVDEWHTHMLKQLVHPILVADATVPDISKHRLGVTVPLQRLACLVTVERQHERGVVKDSLNWFVGPVPLVYLDRPLSSGTVLCRIC